MNVFSVLFVLLVALKLTGVIAWSWWWVCSPIFAELGVLAALTAAVGYLDIYG